MTRTCGGWAGAFRTAVLCLAWGGGLLGCGSGAEAPQAPRRSEPAPVAPAPSAPAAASLPALDDGQLLGLHRHRDAWELIVYRVAAAQRHTLLLPIVDGAIGSPRAQTTYQAGLETPLAVLETDAEAGVVEIVSVLSEETQGRLMSRAVGQRQERLLGDLGRGAELYRETNPTGMHAALSGGDPMGGLVIWTGVRQTAEHEHYGPDDGSGVHAAWVVRSENRRLRVATLGPRGLSPHTLVPWGAAERPVEDRRVIDIAAAASRDHRVALWWSRDLEPGGEERLWLNAAWLDPRGRPVRRARQPLGPMLRLGGTQPILYPDGSVSVIHRSIGSPDGGVTLSVMGFDGSGQPTVARDIAVGVASLEAFPTIRCRDRAWLAFMSRGPQGDGPPALHALEIPPSGPLSSPRHLWTSEAPIACLDGSFVSACAASEAAIAARCWHPTDAETTRLMFHRWQGS